ncbi:MAG: cytochrome b/b6 domain-containing protein [Gammaproteobacteria bacterium]|nr:cytochrome b/b6 domain-containing protein [Gammaproteobacteria bacterium]
MRNSIVRKLVWDPFVRVFHWSLVAAYVVAWLSAEELAALHERAGYFIAVLIVLRVAWGLVGTMHARFSDFLAGPRQTFAYLGSLLHGGPRHYLGHNPAGGWMVVSLLLCLALVVFSGVMMGLYGERWEDLHEGAANLSLVLVVVHVSGVVVAGWLHRENLIRAMVTGYKLRGESDV